ncbi:MAG: hypothetical protein EPN88_01445 [Bacteroidetes bacterium]|nr:MAG: hypothetical protein EPN88_01445 [Bacteroidota bacterium]
MINNNKMVARYYLGLRPHTNEYHAVHKEGCPFLPDDKKRIFLGAFNSVKDAVREGQKHFIRTGNCQFCSKEHQPDRGQPAFCEKDIIPTDSQISQSLKGNPLYFLN